MTLTTAAWLGWAAVSLVAAVIAAIMANAILAPAYVEASIVAFAVGMAWSAGTATILRRVGRSRWVRG